MLCRDKTHHCILSHQDHTVAAKAVPDLMNMMGTDIVDRDDEDGLELFAEALELVEVDSLGTSLAPHVFLLCEDRIFKGKEVEMLIIVGVREFKVRVR